MPQNMRLMKIGTSKDDSRRFARDPDAWKHVRATLYVLSTTWP